MNVWQNDLTYIFSKCVWRWYQASRRLYNNPLMPGGGLLVLKFVSKVQERRHSVPRELVEAGDKVLRLTRFRKSSILFGRMSTLVVLYFFNIEHREGLLRSVFFLLTARMFVSKTACLFLLTARMFVSKTACLFLLTARMFVSKTACLFLLTARMFVSKTVFSVVTIHERKKRGTSVRIATYWSSYRWVILSLSESRKQWDSTALADLYGTILKKQLVTVGKSIAK